MDVTLSMCSQNESRNHQTGAVPCVGFLKGSWRRIAVALCFCSMWSIIVILVLVRPSTVSCSTVTLFCMASIDAFSVAGTCSRLVSGCILWRWVLFDYDSAYDEAAAAAAATTVSSCCRSPDALFTRAHHEEVDTLSPYWFISSY